MAHRLVACSALVAAAVALAGCNQTMGEIRGRLDGTGPTTNYDAGSPDDTCYPQRSALVQDANYFGGSIAETFLQQALLDVILKTVESTISGGDAGAIVLAGLTDAAAKAAVGYWQQRAETAGDNRAALFGAVASDYRQENERIRAFDTKLNALVNCRKADVQAILADRASGRRTADQARTDLVKAKAAYDQDLELARKVKQDMDQRGSQLSYASEQVNPGSAVFLDPTLRVARSAVRMRSGPSTDHAILTTLQTGEQVATQDQSNGWFSVTRQDGSQGWVSGDFLETPSERSQRQQREAALAKTTAATPAEREAAEEVADEAFTNVAARRSVDQTVEEADAFNEEFTGMIETAAASFETVRAA